MESAATLLTLALDGSDLKETQDEQRSPLELSTWQAASWR